MSTKMTRRTTDMLIHAARPRYSACEPTQGEDANAFSPQGLRVRPGPYEGLGYYFDPSAAARTDRQEIGIGAYRTRSHRGAE